ncbi:MAG: flagellar biosynthetic protein FliQ [Eubacteriales bacterium]|nr:flagellar biosynthetic protein FliQ [Eubacteriales bacterium]MDD3289466.1 flagellar biosynthetic protein FliQ [Eubacteriales bacterium]MDD3863230.1 flagellar biosynthetic protein FliQ [Eubacteriales bacterium]
MDTIQLMEVFRDAILTGAKVAGPILLVSIVVGLFVSVIQAATSINEQTMTFVPKLIAIGMVLILAGGWMLQQMVDLVNRVFEFIAAAF